MSGVKILWSFMVMSSLIFTNPSVLANGQDLLKSGILRVATAGSPPPFTYGGKFKNYNLDGIEIRLMDEIARRLGLTYEPVIMQLNGIIPGLLQESFECSSISMDITEERKKKVDFVPWIAYDVCFIGRKGMPEGHYASSNFPKLKVGVEVSSVYAKLAQKNGVQEVIFYQSPADFLLALEQGQIDMTVLPRIIAEHAIHVKKLPFVVLDPPLETLESGWPFNKNNTQLRDAVSRVLAEMKADGTYQKIVDDIIHPPASINVAP
jgi:polar amino acid transport system substrate-binding protein